VVLRIALDKADAWSRSSCLSERALSVIPAHRKRFSGLMMRCMGFVMGKLGAKGVFHNTLLFSGRFLVSVADCGTGACAENGALLGIRVL
jgi:hypothetical protein